MKDFGMRRRKNMPDRESSLVLICDLGCDV